MRDIPVGKPSSLLVTFDDKYQIRDVYFPHVGQENHSEGFPVRFGVWAKVISTLKSIRARNIKTGVEILL